MAYKIALAGNPNSGKTTLFNELTGSTQRVGNWPGVTVDKKDGFYKHDKNYAILDLPGTYSLSPYTAEEIIARDYILEEKPDAVINIVDGTSIERGLYLSLQILETGVPTVIALNMMDEVEARGDKIDLCKLAEIFGVEVVAVTARNGKGLENLMAAVKRTVEGKKTPKVLRVFDHSELEARAAGDEDELEMLIADARYNFIEDVVKQSVKKTHTEYVETFTNKLDRILTNKYLAFPIFALIMYVLFACVNSENFLFLGINSPGLWLAGIAESMWGTLTDILAGVISGASPWLQALVIDGVMEGVGAVVGFLPLVLVLYLLISFLEDCGYMARIAFVLDRVFRKFGLSGRAFIPLLQGFGCSVPAIMGARILDTEKDRKITTILAGFMPCGAKLPIFALFAATIFADINSTVITYSIYITSIVVAIVVALLLNLFVYKDTSTCFIMELPQYRFPTLKSLAIHAWEKVKEFAVRAGGIILISTIAIWLLSNFNVNSFNGHNAAQNADGSIMCEMDDSFLAGAGKIIAPVFKPLGFGEWRPAVGVVTGWIAKENVVVAMEELYHDEIAMEADMGRAGAYAYMIFNLLCMPCFAAVGAMKRELKTWRNLGFAVAVQMCTAYAAAFLAYGIGLLIW